MVTRMSDHLRHKAHLTERISSWLADGDTWIGVFENLDLSDANCGMRCAFPFSLSDESYRSSKVGATRAPDGINIGPGWRYILVGKTKRVKRALVLLGIKPEGKKA